jgi:putative transposase
LLTDHIGPLRDAVRKVHSRKPFHIDAWVVLPDHLHTVSTLPQGDMDCSGRWQAIKTEFSKPILPGEHRSASRESKGERGLWQRRFCEHTIRNDNDYATHVDYVHFNPVRHGLVGNVAAWPYLSFRNAVARGLYPAAWAGGGIAMLDAADLYFGEQ